MIHNLISQDDTYPANYTPSDEHSAKVSVVFDNYDPYSDYGRNPYAMNNNDDIIDNIDLSHSHDMARRPDILKEGFLQHQWIMITLKMTIQKSYC